MVDYTHLESLIAKFCKIILTKNDGIDKDAANTYISNLTADDRRSLNLEHPHKNYQVRAFVQSEIANYLETYDNFTIEKPFEFDNGGTIDDFRVFCNKCYGDKYDGVNMPPVIEFVLKYIQDISEHYKIFGCFYEARSKETSNDILLKMENTAKEKATEAVKSATKQSAQEAVKSEIDTKMNDVTKNISETSVTILGIFAGIVLTVVAGLFYSSSVLDNINSVNFCRLISVSALIGFVCYSLIALMFRYIERIKYGKDETPRFNKLSIGISCVLLAITILFGGLQYIDSNSIDSTVRNESVVDVNITTAKDETQTKSDEAIEQNNDEPDKNIPSPEKETNIQTKAPN